jgi:hypothetical protein
LHPKHRAQCTLPSAPGGGGGRRTRRIVQKALVARVARLPRPQAGFVRGPGGRRLRGRNNSRGDRRREKRRQPQRRSAHRGCRPDDERKCLKLLKVTRGNEVEVPQNFSHSQTRHLPIFQKNLAPREAASTAHTAPRSVQARARRSVARARTPGAPPSRRSRTPTSVVTSLADTHVCRHLARGSRSPRCAQSHHDAVGRQAPSPRAG